MRGERRYPEVSFLGISSQRADDDRNGWLSYVQRRIDEGGRWCCEDGDGVAAVGTEMMEALGQLPTLQRSRVKGGARLPRHSDEGRRGATRNNEEQRRGGRGGRGGGGEGDSGQRREGERDLSPMALCQMALHFGLGSGSAVLAQNPKGRGEPRRQGKGAHERGLSERPDSSSSSITEEKKGEAKTGAANGRTRGSAAKSIRQRQRQRRRQRQSTGDAHGPRRGGQRLARPRVHLTAHMHLTRPAITRQTSKTGRKTRQILAAAAEAEREKRGERGGREEEQEKGRHKRCRNRAGSKLRPSQQPTHRQTGTGAEQRSSGRPERLV